MTIFTISTILNKIASILNHKPRKNAKAKFESIFTERLR